MSDGFVSVGHPVDVASGVVFTACHDFTLDGRVPIDWRRFYSTASTADGWHGRGWAVPYFMVLRRTPTGYDLTDEVGGTVHFPAAASLAVGDRVVDFVANMELTREPAGYVVLHWHFGEVAVERFVFPAAGPGPWPLAGFEDVTGFRVSVRYDPRGRPAAVRQELEGREVALVYGPGDLIAAVEQVLADGSRRRLADYRYDADRHLVEARDALGQATRYAYDPQHRLVAERNPLGSTFRFTYDARGRCHYTSGDNRYIERTLTFSDTPKVTRVRDSQGDVTTYHLNSAGQVVQEVSPRGCVTTHDYDQYGRRLNTVSPDGGVTAFEYDARGDRVAVTDPRGGRTATAFDHQHLPASITLPDGAAFLYVRDARGFLSQVVDPLGQVWSYTRNGRGLVDTALSPAGVAYTFRYDPALLWVETSDPDGLLSRVEYDEFGNVTALIGPGGRAKRYRYDTLNRMTGYTDEAGVTVQLGRNAAGEVVSRQGYGSDRGTWVYDAFGNLLSQTNPTGATMRLEYDTEGSLTAVVNRVGERMTFAYDADGNLTEERFFDGRVQRYAYDGVGRCERVTRPGGRTIDLRYGPGGDLVGRTASDGYAESFEYDHAGRVTAAVSPDGQVAFERDQLGRVTAAVQNGRRVEYRHDPANNTTSRRLVGLTGPGAEVTLTFNRRNQAVALADAAGPVLEFSYDAGGLMTERRGPGGFTERYGYDTAGRWTDQAVGPAGGPARRRVYAYDPNFNVTSADETGRGVTGYRYDDINRLVAADGPLGPERYAYDALGAIQSTHRGGRATGPGGRVEDDGVRRYEYDPDGCVSRVIGPDETLDLRYNVDGGLTSVASSRGWTARYGYDALGRRVTKDVGGVVTEFLWDGAEVVAELDGEATRRCFLAFDFDPVVQWEGDTRLFPTTDRSGLVRELWDAGGRLTWEVQADAYGAVRNESDGPGCPFRFRGQYHDRETGFYYNLHRTYNPAAADYLSPDPLGIEGGSHFHAYPRNPLVCDDPFGLRCGSNKCKGKMGEKRMDKRYQNDGFEPVHTDGRPRGIDGVYKNKDPNGKPQYIIVEAKYGSSDLKRTNDNNKQLSDGWVNSGIGGGTPDRLTAAVGPTEAAKIRAAAATPGNVGKEVYRAPAGSPGYREPAGNYGGAKSTESEVIWP